MPKFYDTLLWEYIKNPWVRWLSLDKLGDNLFDYKMISFDEITNKWNINFADVELNFWAIYSAEDVYITHKLYKKQLEEEITNNNILIDIEIPLIEVLKEIELNWVKIDRNKLKWIWLLLENEKKILEKKIYEKIDEEFNIQSPKQVWYILFEKLWLAKWKKTKTGYSVSADVLLELAHDYSIAQKIIDYRHYSKLLSTYIDWLLELMQDNDLVHTSYNSTVTTTWRLSSNKPNLQNIPSSNWIAWEIRDAFISRWDKWYIISLDYSQVEIRLLALMSNDINLLNAFNDWIDIHHKTAEFIFPWITITNSERKIAKAVNFWVIYGISSFWLSKMINISVKDAKKYIEKFYDSYPNVKIFFDKIIKKCEETWYVKTLYWRKRYIPNILDRNKIIKNTAIREAINMPIQWTSADIIKIAMIRIHKFLNENNLKSKIIMQVHDELVFDVVNNEKDIIEIEIKKIMESILIKSKLNFEINNSYLKSILKVDVFVWKTWKETK